MQLSIGGVWVVLCCNHIKKEYRFSMTHHLVFCCEVLWLKLQAHSRTLQMGHLPVLLFLRALCILFHHPTLYMLAKMKEAMVQTWAIKLLSTHRVIDAKSSLPNILLHASPTILKTFNKM